MLIPLQNLRKPNSTILSPGFVIVVFGLLVTLLTNPLMSFVLPLANWIGNGASHWKWFPTFKSIPIILLSITISAAIFYVLYFAVIVIKLFKSFWESIEDD